jgi:nucleoside-diphosphate-sugar epimerase
MKIAITGHSAGIGQALASAYQSRGHTIVGLSRRNGYNIRSFQKVADQIEDCDMFINNAQAGFAQTELLFEMFRRWETQCDKVIVNISSELTRQPSVQELNLEMDLYRIQKLALEESVIQLRRRSNLPRLVIVRPGQVYTQEWMTCPPAADPTVWAETVVNCLESVEDNLQITELTVMPRYDT